MGMVVFPHTTIGRGQDQKEKKFHYKFSLSYLFCVNLSSHIQWNNSNSHYVATMHSVLWLFYLETLKYLQNFLHKQGQSRGTSQRERVL